MVGRLARLERNKRNREQFRTLLIHPASIGRIHATASYIRSMHRHRLVLVHVQSICHPFRFNAVQRERQREPAHSPTGSSSRRDQPQAVGESSSRTDQRCYPASSGHTDRRSRISGCTDPGRRWVQAASILYLQNKPMQQYMSAVPTIHMYGICLGNEFFAVLSTNCNVSPTRGRCRQP